MGHEAGVPQPQDPDGAGSGGEEDLRARLRKCGTAVPWLAKGHT